MKLRELVTYYDATGQLIGEHTTWDNLLIYGGTVSYIRDSNGICIGFKSVVLVK
jgi:hypothetical protein